MGDVLTFTPRPRLAEPPTPEPVSDLTLRAQLEEAAELAIDTAERLIALLDRIDGDTDLEDGADAEPSLAAPESQGSQVTWTSGTNQDHEADVPEVDLPEVVIEPLPWGGNGNVVAACGVMILKMVSGVR